MAGMHCPAEEWSLLKGLVLPEKAVTSPAAEKFTAVTNILIGQIRREHEVAAKAAKSCENLPIETVDISPFIEDGTEEEKKRVASQVRSCWQSLGFLLLIGHGIPPDVLIKLKKVTEDYLNSTTTKEKLEINEQWVDALKEMPMGQAALFRGYSPPRMENLGLFQGERGKLPDTCEKFTAGTQPDSSFTAPPSFLDDEAEKYYYGVTGANVWPPKEKAPDFEEAWNAWLKHLQVVSRALLKACAMALDLEEDFFVNRIAPAGFYAGTARVIHYPPTTEIDPVARIKAHTDGGLVTVLWRPDDSGLDAGADAGGLEVYHEGTWKRAPQPSFDTLTINIGDLFQWWSKGNFLSTLHRVAPNAKAPNAERTAFPFFLVPNNDIEVSPLADLTEDGKASTRAEDKMRYGNWFDIRSMHLAGIDENLDGVPDCSRSKLPDDDLAA